jgi:hypothetical protein
VCGHGVARRQKPYAVPSTQRFGLAPRFSYVVINEHVNPLRIRVVSVGLVGTPSNARLGIRRKKQTRVAPVSFWKKKTKCFGYTRIPLPICSSSVMYSRRAGKGQEKARQGNGEATSE